MDFGEAFFLAEEAQEYNPQNAELPPRTEGFAWRVNNLIVSIKRVSFGTVE